MAQSGSFIGNLLAVTKQLYKNQTNNKSLIMTINLLSQPEARLPSWAKGRLFKNVTGPNEIETLDLETGGICADPSQLQCNAVPSGYQVLKALAPSCSLNIRMKNEIEAGPNDRIHSCYGDAALRWIMSYWDNFPRAVRSILKGNCLCGWADVAYDDHGHLSVPRLSFETSVPTHRWQELRESWPANHLMLLKPKA